MTAPNCCVDGCERRRGGYANRMCEVHYVNSLHVDQWCRCEQPRPERFLGAFHECATCRRRCTPTSENPDIDLFIVIQHHEVTT